MKNIKSLKSIIEYDDEKFVKEYHEYDENGNETQKVIYLNETEIEEKIISKYNDQGNVIEEISYGENNELNTKTLYFRNENNKLNQVILEYADGSKTIRKYTYSKEDKEILITEISDENEFESKELVILNNDGAVIEKQIINEFNDVTEKRVYEYNEDKNLLLETLFENNKAVSITKYTYNDKKNVTKRTITSSDNKLIDVVNYSYDTNGNLIEQQYGDYTLFKIEYNESGKVISEQKVNSMGIVEYLKKYFYNENGNVEKEEDISSSIRYEYDYY